MRSKADMGSAKVRGHCQLDDAGKMLLNGEVSRNILFHLETRT